MRATQLWRWIYHYGVTDFAKMTDVAKELRAQLGEKFVLERPPISAAQVSVDGTRKWLVGYGPNVEAECVYIPDVGKAGALCVSSQVGCTLTCSFCHTGTQKLVRNLTSGRDRRSGHGRPRRARTNGRLLRSRSISAIAC